MLRTSPHCPAKLGHTRVKPIISESIVSKHSCPWGLLFLAVLPFITFWPVTIGQKIWADGDIFVYNYPFLYMAAQQWKMGTIPLWSPYLFGGTPLMAALQTGVFYPLNVIFLFLPLWRAYGLSILLHYSLIGVLTFLYVRSLEIKHWGALFSGLVFMFSGFCLGHLGHVTSLRTLPWLPLILLSMEKWRRASDRRFLALGAIAVAFLLLAGHPQIPLFALIVACLYVVYLAFISHSIKVLLGCVAILAFGAALAGIQLVPSIELATHEYYRNHNFDTFTSFSVHPLQLIGLVLPKAIKWNLAEQLGYVGILTLPLAMTGITVTMRSKASEIRYYSYFFTCLATASLLVVMGKYTPLSTILYHIPVFNSFSSIARHWFEFHFALAVLAGIGIDSLAVFPTSKTVKLALISSFMVLVLLILSAIGMVAFAQHLFSPSLAEAIFQPNSLQMLRQSTIIIGISLLFLIGILLLLFLNRWRKESQNLSFLCLLVILVIDLSSVGSSIYNLYPPSTYTEPPAVLDFLSKAITTTSPYRILTIGDPTTIPSKKALLFRNYNAVYGVESINGFDGLVLRQIVEASHWRMPSWGVVEPGALEDPGFVRFIRLMNVRYILCPPELNLDSLNLAGDVTQVYSDDQVKVWEYKAAFARAWIVPKVQVVSHQEAIAAMHSGQVHGVRFQLRQTALIEKSSVFSDSDVLTLTPVTETNLPEQPTPIDDEAPMATILSSTPDEITIQTRSENDGFLVHSMNYSNGWRVYIDGEEKPIYRTNGFLQGTFIPAGGHQIEFRYRPVSVLWGGIVSLCSFLAIMGLFAYDLKQKRSRTLHQGESSF